MPFWPVRRPLLELETYQSTVFWFSGMKRATKKAYRTHLRLFCTFYGTDPSLIRHRAAFRKLKGKNRDEKDEL